MNSPKCIVCGRPIKKRFCNLWFMPATANGRANGERDGSSVYLDTLPPTKEAAQRYINQEIVKVTMSGNMGNGGVLAIKYWEGDYEDKFFCTGTCARKQGYASANHGHRYTWS